MSQAAIQWRWLSFNELSVRELYQLLQLREQVFQIEQNSLYVDIDGQDQQALHLLLSDGDTLLGYLRLLQPAPELLKLGRIVLAPAARGQKLGKPMIQEGIAKAKQLANHGTVKISAQLTLNDYYQSLGFTVISSPYDDGGVLHQDMQLKL
ncbi:GNAT family N-acetyltransferase [Ferrimonas senticii]|uniref:GNAT family N-acetyltransferase n=1 Tax=Ferrimonas senticii TaxID=394566 RepID=UPI000485F93D|nr:GNAT family N-acetyltransferase [Ferrimonas senticii]